MHLKYLVIIILYNVRKFYASVLPSQSMCYLYIFYYRLYLIFYLPIATFILILITLERI